MSLKLLPPEKPLDAVKAMAGSGSSGVSKKYQAELKRRKLEELSAEVRGGK